MFGQREIVGDIRRQVYLIDMTADEACHTVAGKIAEDARHYTHTAQQLSNLKKQDTKVNSEIDPNYGNFRTKVVVVEGWSLAG